MLVGLFISFTLFKLDHVAMKGTPRNVSIPEISVYRQQV